MVAARATFAVAATPAVRAAFALDRVSARPTATNAACAAVAAFTAIAPTAWAAACDFVEIVAATVAPLRLFSAAATAAKRPAIADFAAAAASAFDIKTRLAATCFARLSIGRFRAARSREVPTIAGIAAFL